MKKILATLALTATIATTFCGCEYNRTIVDTAWSYDTAIIQRFDGEQEVEIKSWCDYENSDMVQITAKDGTVYLTHSANVILIKKK